MNEHPKLKHYFWILLDLAMVGVVIALFYGAFAVKRYSKSLPPVRTVTVGAEGKTIVTPDMAEFSFSVVTEGVKPDTIADEGNKKMNAAIAFVKSQGVQADDIKTTQYALTPKYEYEERLPGVYPYRSSPRIVGYTLTQGALVKVKDLPKTATIIAGLPDAGVNTIGGITFGLQDPEKSLAVARADAFSKVKVKAEMMARMNGVRLKKILNFSEYQSGYPGPYYGRSMALGMGGEPASTPPSIEPGSEETRVQVNVTYEIE